MHTDAPTSPASTGVPPRPKVSPFDTRYPPGLGSASGPDQSGPIPTKWPQWHKNDANVQPRSAYFATCSPGRGLTSPVSVDDCASGAAGNAYAERGGCGAHSGGRSGFCAPALRDG